MEGEGEQDRKGAKKMLNGGMQAAKGILAGGRKAPDDELTQQEVERLIAGEVDEQEEQAVREKLVVQDRLAMEAVKARRETERSEGASDVYTPNASLRSASLRLARRGRPSTAPTTARSTRVPNTPNRSTAGMLRAAGSVVPQRGWIV